MQWGRIQTIYAYDFQHSTTTSAGPRWGMPPNFFLLGDCRPHYLVLERPWKALQKFDCLRGNQIDKFLEMLRWRWYLFKQTWENLELRATQTHIYTAPFQILEWTSAFNDICWNIFSNFLNGNGSGYGIWVRCIWMLRHVLKIDPITFSQTGEVHLVIVISTISMSLIACIVVFSVFCVGHGWVGEGKNMF